MAETYVHIRDLAETESITDENLLLIDLNDGTDNVKLKASSLKKYINGAKIPVNTSDLVNDSDFATNSKVDSVDIKLQNNLNEYKTLNDSAIEVLETDVSNLKDYNNTNDTNLSNTNIAINNLGTELDNKIDEKENEIETLRSTVSSLQSELALSPICEYKNGTNINITDGVESNVILNKIDGANIFYNYSGKNLLNLNNLSTTIDDTLEISVAKDKGQIIGLYLNGKCRYNNTHTFVSGFQLDAGDYKIVLKSDNDDIYITYGYNSIGYECHNNGTSNFTITSDNKYLDHITLNVPSSVTFNNCLVCVMVCKQSATETYEPYVGGNPTPSPNSLTSYKDSELNLYINDTENLLQFNDTFFRMDDNIYDTIERVGNSYKITKRTNRYKIGTGDNWCYTSNGVFYSDVVLNDANYGDRFKLVFSNAFVQSNVTSYDELQNGEFCVLIENRKKVLYVRNSTFSDITSFGNWITQNNIYFYYALVNYATVDCNGLDTSVSNLKINGTNDSIYTEYGNEIEVIYAKNKQGDLLLSSVLK